jgi:uncharacterized repeat protein (TIGR02543 family)
MKKLLSLILTFSLIITVIPLFNAQTTSALDYNNFTYEITGSEISITGGTPVNGFLEIPSSIDGKSVTSIKFNAFFNNQEITSLILPESVIRVGSKAFGECKNLKAANLMGVRILDGSPFYMCTNLLTVKFGNQITQTEIYNDPFDGCYNLNSVYIVTAPTDSYNAMFQNASDGLVVYYSDKTSGWDNYLTKKNKVPFNPDSKYTVTYDPNGATSGTVPIDSNLYEYNTFFTVADNTGNLVKPGAEFLGWNTNRDGTSVDHYAGDVFDIETGNVVLYAMWSDGRDQGDQNEWTDNTGITWQYTEVGELFCSIDNADPAVGVLEVPEIINGRKVIAIGAYAFYDCSELTEVVLPDNITGIHEYAFSGCTGISSLSIPSGTAYIDDTAFYNSELTAIIVDHSNAYYSSYQGVMYNKFKTVIENFPPGKDYIETIVPSITTIASGAFATSYKISNIDIPESVTKIEGYAFYECNSITQISLSASIVELDELSFLACASLTHLNVAPMNPNYTTEDGVLYNKNLTELICCPSGKETVLYLPLTVSKISETGLMGCFDIPGFQANPSSSYFSSLDGVLFNKNKSMIIQCPVLKEGTYTLPSSVTEIRSAAFSWCYNLTSIILPSNLKTIGPAAFMGCMSLETIAIPASVTSISDSAFNYNVALESVYFRGNAPLMGEGVFDFTADAFTIYYPSLSTGYTTPTWLNEEYNTAKYIYNITVTFSNTGGTPSTKAVNFNSTVAAPATPARTGYIFAGWFTSMAYTTPWVFATNKVTSNITLYVKWIASQVTGLKAASAGYNSVKLTWTATPGANNYEIYRATSLGGTYYLVTTIPATSLPTYTNTALGTGTTYYYKVRAYSLNGTTKTYNNYSAISSAKPLPATPTGLVAQAASYSSTKLSWTAVAGASGYSVYRATSSTGTYTLLATVTTNTYTKTSLALGTTYYYKVIAYRLVGTTKVYGGYSGVVGARVVPPTPISLVASSPSYNSIKLTWGAVYGANGYSVYRATSATGTYTFLATVTTNTYTNISLAIGTTYYYKVNAYRLSGSTKIYGSQSAAVTKKVVPATITTFNVVRAGSTSINLSWGAISGANGYELYRATSSTGAYVLVITQSALTYINLGLATGTTYYYKIRSYRLVGTAKVYSDFSVIKYAKP